MTKRPSSTATVANSPAPVAAQNFLINKIRMEGGTQIRVALDPEVIEGYHQDMLKGDDFPPITLFFDGKDHWLGDGFYRTHARMKNPAWTTISAEIRQGTLRDAILYAIGANATHGRPRTNEEKRRAVARLLEDEEWRKLADNVLCKMARVTQPFVSSERRKLSQNILSGQPDVRIGSDNKPRNTSNIGRRKKEEPALLDMSEIEDDTDITPLDTDFHVSAPSEDNTPDESIKEDSGRNQSNLFDKQTAAPTPQSTTTKTPSATQQRPTTPAQKTQAEPDTDPEGWSDLQLRINITIKPGKSPRRAIILSGQAGDNTPIFLSQYNLASLDPIPVPVTELIASLKRAYAKKTARASTKQTKPGQKARSKKHGK